MARKNDTGADSLLFAFDIGHASVGWAVLDEASKDLRGSGVVIFPPDDCLASKRRTYRRQRRHVRATRQRVARMARLIVAVLERSPRAEDQAFAAHLRGAYLEKPAASREAADLNGPEVPVEWRPHASPWHLSARVLAATSERGLRDSRLSWPRLWDVLRWYAHNRGYDGNRLWSRDGGGPNEEDAEKVKHARELLDRFHKDTMAETIVSKLRLGEKGRAASSEHAYKTADAAFPRSMVAGEVRRVIEAHIGHLPGVDAALVDWLCADGMALGQEARLRALAEQRVRLPARFVGGVLFGQLVPRFDNRIIGKCLVTGKNKPLKDAPEYLRFRWSQTLANVSVYREGHALSKLTAKEKQCLDKEARRTGGFTKGEFKKQVRELTGGAPDNLDQFFMHPEAEKSLVLDPPLRFVHSGKLMQTFWPLLDETTQRHGLNRWRRHRRTGLAWFLSRCPGIEKPLRAGWEEARKRTRKGKEPISWEAWTTTPLEPDFPSGRAPYSAEAMAQASELFLADPERDPRLEGGLLFPPTLRETEARRSLDDTTNNHLIRQRLRILAGDSQPKNLNRGHRAFHGLLHDLIQSYAGGDKSRVSRCVVEVARDIQEFSGKTNKEIAQEMGSRLKNFQDIVTRLQKAGLDRLSAGLIRKARIADDLGWCCPYTDPRGLHPFSEHELAHGTLDKDHVVPRSRRRSDSLDSLVVTYPEVNRLKGDRTALQFVREFAGREVRISSGRTVRIASEKDFLDFVNKLAPDAKPGRFTPGAGHLDDKLRRWRRKQKLLVEKWDREDKDFTPGDLTVTSHLSRLAAVHIARYFGWGLEENHRVVSLPGQVTGAVRKSWDVTGCLIPACPEVRDPDDPKGGALREKRAIRDITHLHHALDACVMAYAALWLPNNGKLWQFLANGKVRKSEIGHFQSLDLPKDICRLGPEKSGAQKLELCDLPAPHKDQIVSRLLERRVVQHVPSDMSGALLEETTWAVVAREGERVKVRQYSFDKKDIDTTTGARRRRKKETTENAGKVLGLESGKLSQLKGVRVIAGNFGLALFDPTTGLPPEIVPHHQVWKRLAELRAKNGGKPVAVLKNGMLIRVRTQPKREGKKSYLGVWRVVSIVNNIRDGVLLKMIRPDRTRLVSNVEWAADNVRIRLLSEWGLEIVKCTLSGTDSRT